STYDKDETSGFPEPSGNGGVVAAATRPTLDVATDLPAQDEYEVRVYDAERNQRLVAAVELASPGNKDRPENRHAFVANCLALLQNQGSVPICDPGTHRTNNLYAEMLDAAWQSDPALGEAPPATYAVACRAIKTTPKPGESWRLQTWFHRLEVGEA